MIHAMKNYQPKFYDLLTKAGIDRAQLDVSLQNLIDKFEIALNSINREDEKRQIQLLNVLVQADAVITANISKLINAFPDKSQPEPKEITVNLDKAKLMAMKAKALQLRWKMK